MYKKSLLTLLLIFSLFKLNAQDSTETDDGKLTITGYVDTYYFKNLNNPLSAENWGQSGFERVFDVKEGQFQLGLAQTKFVYANSKSEVGIDLVFGQNADLANYGNVISLNAGAATSTALAIKQAYWTYNFTDAFSATAGIFGTHIGYEVIDAPVNFNYSLSNLFANGPFYHTGLKFNYAINDKFGLMAGVVNGWDSPYDNNRYKTIIGQIFLSPAENWNIYLNFIGGNEEDPTPSFSKPIDINAKDTINAKKMMVDLTTGYQITDKFYVGLNAAYGIETKFATPTLTDSMATKTQPWGGVALYTNYAFSDVFALGARAEYFDNTQGVQYLVGATGGTNVTALTLTGNINLANGHFILKPEIRADIFKKFAYTGPESGDIQQLMDSEGNFTKNTQTTIGMAAIYKF